MISGDSPVTVGALARKAGITTSGDAFDARDLPGDASALADVMESYSVFGRVKPEQKRAMVNALKARGKYVAMVGDGVNDVLALKDADMGIAMGNGSAATRAVAQVVLLESKFDALPKLTAEGRRVLANVERTTYLWGTKVVAAFLFAFFVALLNTEYPFLPRHLTLVNVFAVSTPAFFLALQPNEARFRPGFGGRAALFALPAGILIGAAVLGMYYYATRTLGYDDGDQLRQAQTAAVALLITCYLAAVVRIARPLNAWKLVLVGLMFVAYALVFSWPWLREDVLLLALPTGELRAQAVGACVVAFAVIASGMPWKIVELFGADPDPTSDVV
jgi:cation-transporting ATPase E